MSAANFATLRQTALERLQLLAGTTWTDHNAHDPGITILEQLCYVLTDLAYRANFEVRDLLAGPVADERADSLYSPADILTTCPVTGLDLRKVVLDVEGVANAWIEPVRNFEPPLSLDPAEETLRLEEGPKLRPVTLRGVYQVLVAAAGGASGPELARQIRRRLNACRRLGEDFASIQILPQQQIPVSAEIEIDHAGDPAAVLRAVYQTAADYLAPRVRFHTLPGLLARGLPIEEIFDGPRLEHGFIDTAELAQLARRPGLRASDLLAQLMAVDGVRAVHGLRLGGEAWYLELDLSSTPVLDFAHSAFKLRRGQVVWTPSAGDIRQIAGDLRWADAPSRPDPADLDLTVPAGRDRRIERYHSVQHHLPRVYGVGAAGLPADAPVERQAQARQLRAYLMLFDQVLANCFSQTAHARELLALAGERVQSYFSQLPADAPRSEEILNPAFDGAALQALTEDPATAINRVRRFLDHLLARFAEDLGDFQLLGDAMRRQPAQHVAAQRAFLRAYPAASGGRGCGFDHSRPSWGEANRGNLSGLEQRVAFKLGLANFWRRALADLPDDDEGGFHLIEHVLLRPRPADLEPEGTDTWLNSSASVFLAAPDKPDPYSNRITFVFPDWVTAFGAGTDPDLMQSVRDYIAKTVREETPAHLSARVLFLNRDEMAAFEPAYRAWLDSMVKTP